MQSVPHRFVTDDDPPRIVDLDKSYLIEVDGSKVVARFASEDDVALCHTGGLSDVRNALGRVFAWLEGNGPDPCAEQRDALVAEAER